MGCQGGGVASTEILTQSSETLARVQILPIQDLPSHYDGEKERLELLRRTLDEQMRLRTQIDQGRLLEADGFKFVVVMCEPVVGTINVSTELFVCGPPLPRLRRIELTTLEQRAKGYTDRKVMAECVRPFFKNIAHDKSRCAVVMALHGPMNHSPNRLPKISFKS